MASATGVGETVGAGRETPRKAHRAVSNRARTAVAHRIQDHDPGRRQKDWQRLAGEMHRSALDLATALRTRQEDATLLAARRLSASCQKCHEIFRD
jgi:hypothetical protein